MCVNRGHCCVWCAPHPLTRVVQVCFLSTSHRYQYPHRKPQTTRRHNSLLQTPTVATPHYFPSLRCPAMGTVKPMSNIGARQRGTFFPRSVHARRRVAAMTSIHYRVLEQRDKPPHISRSHTHTRARWGGARALQQMVASRRRCTNISASRMFLRRRTPNVPRERPVSAAGGRRA